MKCPICENRDIFNLIEKWGEYEIYHCRKCDIIFSYPMKNPGSKWYEESELYVLGKTFRDSAISWHHAQFIHNGKVFGDSLLDVGCGNGAFLNEAQKLGYKVVGIDFDKENIRIARELFGLNEVFSMTLEDLIDSYPDRRFDVITFFEVLEHMDNPNNFINLIKRGLKEGGYIALSMPNRERFIDPLCEGDYPPNHLTRWSASSLTSFLEERGFEIVKLVVKRLDTDDVAGFLKAKIRFRIAHKMVQKGKTQHNTTIVHKAATLMKIKDFTFKIITMPLIPLLKLLKLQGGGLYCMARLR
jgi:SAM-dependent methyltransferase